MRSGIVFSVMVASMVMIGAGATGRPPRFVVTNLGILPGGDLSAAMAINDAGQIVGKATLDTAYPHAVTWIDGRIIDLTGVGVSGAVASAVNSSGQVVGTTDEFLLDSSSVRAFLWQYGVASPLPVLDDDCCASSAESINAAGRIVGLATVAGSFEPNEAVLWNDSARLPAPLELPKGGFSFAHDINDAGLVVGSLFDSRNRMNAVTWHDGGLTILPELGGGFSEAQAINAAGLIVGDSRTVEATLGPIHAVLWRDGRVMDLGTLGGTHSGAEDINDQGWIVGWAHAGNPDIRAALWIDDQIFDLNSLIAPESGVLLADAHGVNNSGRIVGTGSFGHGARAVLLTPAAPADLNLDGVVNTLDLGVLLSSWSIPPTTPGCGGAVPCASDINGDGFVNTLDLGILLSGWTR